jgi:hypothetical protein
MNSVFFRFDLHQLQFVHDDSGKVARFHEIVDAAMQPNATKHDKNKLVDYGRLRKRVFDQLDTYATTQAGGPSKVTSNASGSTNPASDIDLTVIGANKEQYVIAFNERFAEFYGGIAGDVTSAEVFDINVYASNSFEVVESSGRTRPKDARCRLPFVCTELCSSGTKGCSWVATLDLNGDEENVSNERGWAFVQLFLSIDRTKVADVLSPVGKSPLNQHISRAYRLLKHNRRSPTIAGRNQQYKSALLVQRDLRQRLRSRGTKGTVAERRLYADAVANANYYSMEAYITSGAFLHVVGNIQRGLKLPVTRDEYIDSFIENTGMAIHTLLEHGHLDSSSTTNSVAASIHHEADDKKVCLAGLMSATKYISRAAQALDHIVVDTNTMSDHVQEFMLLGHVAEFVRRNVRGKINTSTNLVTHLNRIMLELLQSTCTEHDVEHRFVGLVMSVIPELYR